MISSLTTARVYKDVENPKFGVVLRSVGSQYRSHLKSSVGKFTVNFKGLDFLSVVGYLLLLV